jgi:two-component system phosphate regulon sensor histidine kinase PhoR
MDAFLGLVLASLILVMGFWFFDRRSVLVRRYLQTARQERDETREELRQIRLEMTAITRNISAGILLIDSAEQIVFINSLARQMLDTPAESKLGFSHLSWWIDLKPLIQEVLAHRAESLGQTIIYKERAFQVSVHALPGDARSAALILINEVTELQRLGRVRRDFVANISHELRTPVTSLQLLVETLAKELPSDNPLITDLLNKQQEQVSVLHQLTEEMMGLALIESGQMPIRLVETQVSDLIQKTLEVLRVQAEHKGIQIQVQDSAELCAWADASAVQKVLNNLLHNAIKFTAPGGQIVIRTSQVQDNIEIQIADTGIGINARDLPRIFERFYKADQSRASGNSRGTGLGLAIAKHIVEGHGGTIWAESIEGKGSTFHFTLPACGDTVTSH